MAAPVITTDLVDVIADMPNTTGWTLISSGGGGANSLTAPESDYFIQGISCISRNPFSSSIRGMLYNSSQTVPAGDAVFMWCWCGVSAAINTEAGGGMQICIGNLTTAFKAWYVRGSDTYQYGGWICIPVDPTITEDVAVGAPTSVTSQFGVRWDVPAAGPARGFPFAIDAIRRGRTLTITDGDSGGYATFVLAAAENDDQTNRWGLFQEIDGGYLQQGLFLMGTAGLAVDFRDANRNIAIADTKKVGANFNEFEVRNASSNLEWTNIVIAPLGTTSRGRFVNSNNATISKIGCSFTRMDTFVYGSNSTLTDTTFRQCALVTQSSATFTNCTFEESRATSALLSNNPGLVSGCRFVSDGTGHAIEITTAGSYTFDDNEFSGYAGADGSTGNEAIYNNSGGAVTLNVSGGVGVYSVRNSAGSTTTVVQGAVTLAVTVLDANNDPIENAIVLVRAVAGPLPANASVSITRASTTATVTHTAHGLDTGDKVLILGCAELEYNNVHEITVTGVDSYTYTVAGSPATPATGTPTSTFVALTGLTNASGQISASRVYSANQPISGRVRKSTPADPPLYKARVFPGTLLSASGLVVTVPMELDE